MADTKISALTAATTLADTDQLVIASAGASKSITGANLKASIPGTAGGGGMTRLFDSTLGSGAATIDSGASGIASGYSAIEIVGSFRRTDLTGGSADARLVLNNDTTSTYAWQYVRGLGSTAAAATGTSAAGFPVQTALNDAAANVFCLFRMLIHDYTSTSKKKTASWTDGLPFDGTNSITRAFTGLWPQTTAISRVAVQSANFAAGCRLTVWGWP
jgi:hypothetical protein